MYVQKTRLSAIALRLLRNALHLPEQMAGCAVANRSRGYARMSTVGQTLDAQTAQFFGAGCATIYREKVSGAKVGRRELQRLQGA